MSQRLKLKNVLLNLPPQKSLLDILTDFYSRLSKDILVGFFFDGKDLKHIAQQQMFFLLKSAGETLPQNTVVKSPRIAHEKIAPILSGHFDRRLRVLEQTLKDHELTHDQIQIWLDFEESFRKQIVSE